MPRTILTIRYLTLIALLAIAFRSTYAQSLTEAPAFETSRLVEPPRVGLTTERSILESDPETEPEAAELSDSLEEVVTIEPEKTDEQGIEDLIRTIRSAHPWARFEPGAWRRVVVVSEVFDEEGAFVGRSLSERTERLVSVDESTYTLSVESVVELGGLRTPAPAELRVLSILNDREAEGVTVTASPGEPSSISLGATAEPTRTWLLKSTTPSGTETETLHLATDAVPLVLRREYQSMVDDAPGPQKTESITRHDSPALYGDELSAAWHTVSTTTHPTGARTEAFAVRGDDPPGGLFSESLTEYNAEGRKTRWAVTRLIASGRTPAEAIGSGDRGDQPAVSVEVRPRRFLRLLRREERRQEALEAE